MTMKLSLFWKLMAAFAVVVIVAVGGVTLVARQTTATEFSLLRAMVAEPGRAFSRMERLDAAQGEAYEGYERTIDTHIKNLRGKIEPDPKNPRYVVTVYGVGYKFTEEA